MCKLHIGSGRVSLPGWVNIDIKPYPEVDVVLDATGSLPFDGADFIFAEHFIEHLTSTEALGFLRECRRVLRRSGVLRLSTPNLDWVLRSHYDPSRWSSAAEPIRDCFWLNKAFHGWGHCFLYNQDTLNEILSASGFARMTAQSYGCSRYPALVGLESHERCPDLPDTPHVLVVEASGRAGEVSPVLETAQSDFLVAVESS